MKARFVLRFLGGTILALAGIVAFRLLSTHPSLERNWRPEHARTAEVRWDGDLAHVSDVRNFRFRGREDFDAIWEDRTFDVSRIESVWFVVSPFREDWRGPAHTFLSFGFADSLPSQSSSPSPSSQYIGISVEARKEVGETYSPWKGLLNSYELLYVIADERDLIGLRTDIFDDDVYVYPIRAERAAVRALFVAMLDRAADLGRRPRFYNTLTNNCTTNLYDHVEQLNPERWSFSWKVLLPGYADEMVYDAGVIETTLPLERARERFRVNQRAASFRGSTEFSVGIRQL